MEEPPRSATLPLFVEWDDGQEHSCPTSSAFPPLADGGWHAGSRSAVSMAYLFVFLTLGNPSPMQSVKIDAILRRQKDQHASVCPNYGDGFGIRGVEDIAKQRGREGEKIIITFGKVHFRSMKNTFQLGTFQKCTATWPPPLLPPHAVAPSVLDRVQVYSKGKR